MSIRTRRCAWERLVFLLALIWMAGCSKGCLEEGPAGDCFDPDEPCPIDMVSDETGCVWDRCSGDFTGNPIPCWFAEPGVEVGYFKLAGSQAQYLAYIKKMDEFGSEMLGQVWLYDLETEEHRPISEEGRMCYRIRADGDRIGWLEMVEYEKGSAKRPVVDACVKDIVTGEEWRVPNPEELRTIRFSLSGDRIVVNEIKDEKCEIATSLRQDLWIYDLNTRQKSILASAVPGSYKVVSGEVCGDLAVYWKIGGACGKEAIYQLWLKDLNTGEEKLVEEMNSIVLAVASTADNIFQFDGKWAVGWMGNRMMAWDVETGESREVTPCNRDCRLHLDNGIVAYDRYGEDGLTQRQLYVAEIATNEKRRLTDLRPYYDSAGPVSFQAGRLLWAEGRGKSIYDSCGNVRHPEGKTGLYFWKDIEF